MKKGSVFCLVLMAVAFVFIGNVSAAPTPTLRIMVPDVVIGGKTIPVGVQTEDLGMKINISPSMISGWETENISARFKLGKKSWTMKTDPVAETTGIILRTTVFWGEGDSFEIEKYIIVVPKGSPEAKKAVAKAEAMKNDLLSAEREVAAAMMVTQEAIARAVFVPRRIWIAPYSTLKAYPGTTTNWLYVIAQDAAGVTKIVSQYTAFTLSKSNVIQFPYAIYNANHGNYKALYTITTVTVTCKYSGFITYANISVIRR